MRLDVPHPAPGRPGERLQGADLVEDVGGEVGRRDVDLPPPEPDQVGIGHLGADGHPPLGGRPHRPVDRRRVAGVEPAGHVRARHHLEQRGVVPQSPAPVPLTEVRVQVHGRLPPGGSAPRSPAMMKGVPTLGTPSES